MVDVSELSQLLVANAAFFGIVFLAAGFLLGLASRAVTLFVLALGVLMTIGTVASGWESQQDLLLSAMILGGGLGVSALLALALRWGTIAAEFAVFLVAWYLLLHGWVGADFVSSRLGSILWIVATSVTTSIAARLSRILPRGVRPAIPITPRVR